MSHSDAISHLSSASLFTDLSNLRKSYPGLSDKVLSSMFTAQKEEEAEKRRIELEEEEERKRKEREIERAAAAATREALAKKDTPASSSSTRRRTEYESLSKKVSNHTCVVSNSCLLGLAPGLACRGSRDMHVHLNYTCRCVQ